MDIYLKAQDEQTLWNALVQAGAAVELQIKNEAGVVIETKFVPAEGVNIDIIGVIQKPTGNMIRTTINGVEMDMPEMTTLDGFHANVRGNINIGPTVTVTIPEATETDPNPLPVETITPGPCDALLVTPNNPVRIWF